MEERDKIIIEPANTPTFRDLVCQSIEQAQVSVCTPSRRTQQMTSGQQCRNRSGSPLQAEEHHIPPAFAIAADTPHTCASVRFSDHARRAHAWRVSFHHALIKIWSRSLAECSHMLVVSHSWFPDGSILIRIEIPVARQPALCQSRDGTMQVPGIVDDARQHIRAPSLPQAGPQVTVYCCQFA
jgi:hypothetical protein